MKFEWDPAKSESNRNKHGIDFKTAKGLWRDELRIEIYALHPVENRSIIIGQFQGKLWTCVYTIEREYCSNHFSETIE